MDVRALPENPLKIEQAVKVSGQTASKPAAGEHETVSVPFSRLYRKNGVDCIFSLEGESYRSIASHYGLSLYKLLKFNELSQDTELLPGTVVYISPKKNQASKGLEKYIFGDEPESLREVSQRFGIKLSAILRMNNLSEDHIPAPGETVILRK